MRPVKLVIPGEWWDSLIYAGHLFLFGRDGTVRVIEWNRLIDFWDVPPDLRIAMHCAFARGDSLYGGRWRPVVNDPDVRHILREKFDRLSRRNLVLEAQQLERHTVDRQDIGFSFPHSDIAAYARSLWVASPEGLEVSHWNDDVKRLGLDARRIWDCPLLSLSPNYGTIAMAAGDEGLHELRIDSATRVPRRTVDANCTGCDWLYYSVYASSHDEPSHLASYQRYTEGRDDETRRLIYRREPVGVVDEAQIFGGPGVNGGYSWGSADKICKVTRAGIAVTRYMPGHPDRESQFEQLGTVPGSRKAQVVISGGVALFGIVVELDDALWVLGSDDKTSKIAGVPVNWRIFQRSNWYLNQLHVIHDAHAEILSFNHDYFVDQAAKLAGIRYRERGDPVPRGRR